MKLSESKSLIALLQAYYPGAGRELPESTVELWSNALEKYEIGDGSEAVQLIASHGSYLPSLAEIESAIRSCRDARMLRERAGRELNPPAEDFCSLTDALRLSPELRARAAKLGGVWAEAAERATSVPQVAAEKGAS